MRRGERHQSLRLNHRGLTIGGSLPVGSALNIRCHAGNLISTTLGCTFQPGKTDVLGPGEQHCRTSRLCDAQTLACSPSLLLLMFPTSPRPSPLAPIRSQIGLPEPCLRAMRRCRPSATWLIVGHPTEGSRLSSCAYGSHKGRGLKSASDEESSKTANRCLLFGQLVECTGRPDLTE